MPGVDPRNLALGRDNGRWRRGGTQALGGCALLVPHGGPDHSRRQCLRGAEADERGGDAGGDGDLVRSGRRNFRLSEPDAAHALLQQARIRGHESVRLLLLGGGRHKPGDYRLRLTGGVLALGLDAPYLEVDTRKSRALEGLSWRPSSTCRRG